jgi:hypothetical protein
VQELDARRGHARWIAQIGKLNQRASNLRRGVDPLCGIDANAQPRNERLELPSGEGSENLDE